MVVSHDECEAPTRIASAKKALAALLKPPPVRAALGGLAVAACTPLRDALVGPNARLANVFAALNRFAGAYLPSASLVLAGSLIAGGGGDDDDDAPPGLRRIVALCLHRFCLLPALGAGALFGLAKVGLFPAVHKSITRASLHVIDATPLVFRSGSRRRARRRSSGFSY